MEKHSPAPPPLTGAEETRLATELLAFDQNWTFESLRGFLSARRRESANYRRLALTDLVKIDLEHHWRQGQRKTLEVYLQEFPELGSTESLPVELVFAEFVIRRQFGQPAQIEDFSRRFPQQAPKLRSMIAAARSEGGRRSVMTAKETIKPLDSETSHAQASTSLANSSSSKEPPRPVFADGFGSRYRVLRLLGEGAMGQVYLAEDKKLRRRVALKSPTFTGDNREQLFQRFEQEAQSAARLDHPFVCTIYDYGQHNGRAFISMEYVEGKPLDQVIQSANRLLREEFVVRLAIRIARGLQHAHEQDVVHRDVKPANIMLDRKLNPRVMDFGLAHQVDREESARNTRDGIIMGSPAYMSPEQVEAKADKIGPLVDVYGLGVVIFEMLTGRLPFEGPTISVLSQVMNQAPVDPRAFRPEIAPQLSHLCLKMIAKKPTARPKSMRDTVKALQSIYQSLRSEMSSSGKSEGPHASNGEIRSTVALDSALAEFVAARANEVVPRQKSQARSRELTPRQEETANSLQQRRLVPKLVIGTAIISILFGVAIILRNRNGTETKVTFPDAESARIVNEGKVSERSTRPARAEKPIVGSSVVDVPREPGFALKFGGNHGRIQIPGITLEPGKPFTLEAWCTHDGRGTLFDCPGEFRFGLEETKPGSRNFQWELRTINGPHDERCKVAYRLFCNHRQHLAVVWDGRQLRGYWNGIPGNFEIDDFRITTPSPLFVGTGQAGTFRGVIDEIRISSGARYRLAFHPNDHLKADTETLALYEFQSITDEKALDSSGNDLHATVEGDIDWVPRPESDSEVGLTYIQLKQGNWQRVFHNVNSAPKAGGVKLENNVVTLPNGRFVVDELDQTKNVAIRAEVFWGSTPPRLELQTRVSPEFVRGNPRQAIRCMFDVGTQNYSPDKSSSAPGIWSFQGGKPYFYQWGGPYTNLTPIFWNLEGYKELLLATHDDRIVAFLEGYKILDAKIPGHLGVSNPGKIALAVLGESASFRRVEFRNLDKDPPAEYAMNEKVDVNTTVKPTTSFVPQQGRVASLIMGSPWRIEGEELVHRGGLDEQWIAFGDPNWQDYDFKFEYMVNDNRAFSALVLSPDDNHDVHWGLCWNNSKATIACSRAGGIRHESLLPVKSWPQVETHVWHQVTSKVRGNTLKAFWNGKLVFDIQNLPYHRGRVGLRTRKKYLHHFIRVRNIEVRHADGTLMWSGPPKMPANSRKSVHNSLPVGSCFAGRYERTEAGKVLRFDASFVVTSREANRFTARVAAAPNESTQITIEGTLTPDGRINWRYGRCIRGTWRDEVLKNAVGEGTLNDPQLKLTARVDSLQHMSNWTFLAANSR